MIMQKIDSKENNLIKKVMKLLKSSKYRDEHGLAVIYGEHLVEECLKYNLLTTLIINENILDKYIRLINKIDIYKPTTESKVQLYTINPSIMEKINILDGEIDLVGIIKIKTPTTSGFSSKMDYIVLENIQDPGNLGTILRAGVASGIHNVCLSQNSVDIYNPKVIRSSQGIQFGLNIYTNIDISGFLQNYHGQIIATTPKARDSLYSLDLTLPTAFVFGNEGNGITPNLLKLINKKVKIPLISNVESINIAMCVTVCVFEMARQRLC